MSTNRLDDGVLLSMFLTQDLDDLDHRTTHFRLTGDKDIASNRARSKSLLGTFHRAG
jgi:Family of unknown function (DUF6455)